MTVYYMELAGKYFIIFFRDEPWVKIKPLCNESYWMVPGTVVD